MRNVFYNNSFLACTSILIFADISNHVWRGNSILLRFEMFFASDGFVLGGHISYRLHWQSMRSWAFIVDWKKAMLTSFAATIARCPKNNTQRLNTNWINNYKSFTCVVYVNVKTSLFIVRYMSVANAKKPSFALSVLSLHIIRCF